MLFIFEGLKEVILKGQIYYIFLLIVGNEDVSGNLGTVSGSIGRGVSYGVYPVAAGTACFGSKKKVKIGCSKISLLDIVFGHAVSVSFGIVGIAALNGG